MPEITNPSFEPAWQDYLLTATTQTGEKLTAYSPLYGVFREAFAAGFAARDAEVEALRGDLDRAFVVPDVPAPAVEAVEPDVPAADHVVVARVLRAAAEEAGDIERIGQTPYASIATDEAERFNGHPLSNLYRQSDTRAHITWLLGAADAADAGVLLRGL
ncbi:hypothetical protein [Curtobacterium sp. MCSS17_016]|uniref:hypothetical protein n=1 Tax=Curtobacterium sp. MCSS17_016 TaxID=2175644 RepID=UPI000DA7CCB8|nr:hypothetical protein [Curtobacterium sp. MCSS17_016]WIE81098.1 hypothetical protein DEJ19_021725 [Curtobacterium sp. MCSS17_016]